MFAVQYSNHMWSVNIYVPYIYPIHRFNIEILTKKMSYQKYFPRYITEYEYFTLVLLLWLTECVSDGS